MPVRSAGRDTAWRRRPAFATMIRTCPDSRWSRPPSSLP